MNTIADAMGELAYFLVLIHRPFPGQVSDEQWARAQELRATLRAEGAMASMKAAAELFKLAEETCPVLNPADGD